MSLSVERISDTFVGEVDGVNLSDDHSDGEIGDIRSALMKHGILVFTVRTCRTSNTCALVRSSDLPKFIR